MFEEHNGFLRFTILAASENQTTESTTRNESSWPYSTGGMYVKYPKMMLLVDEVEVLILNFKNICLDSKFLTFEAVFDKLKRYVVYVLSHSTISLE